MHLVRFSLFIIPCLLLILSCQSSDNSENDQIFSLVGVAPNDDDTSAALIFNDTTFDSKIINDTFRFNVSLDGKRTGTLRVNKRFEIIYAEAGESLTIDLTDENATFSGSLAPVHKKYNEIKSGYVANWLPQSHKEKFTLSKDSFTYLVYEGILKIQADIDTSLDKPLSDWGDLMWAELTNRWAYYTLMYPLMYPRYSGDTIFTVDISFYEEAIEKFKIDDLSLLNSSPSREDLVKTAVENWARIDTPFIESDSSRIMFMFGIAEKMYEQDTLSEIAKYNIISDQLKYQGFGDAEPMIREYVTSIQNEDRRQELSNLISKWAQLQEGMKAPDFTAQKIDSTEVSLKDLKGKVVYLDVWATWCGPCLQEVPHLEAMQEHYSNKPKLQIVSVSIDSDYQKWYEMVTEEEMGGLQLWIEKAWDSKLNENYLIKSIPRFILIDKDGNIVDADAPRPSSKEELYALIDSQL